MNDNRNMGLILIALMSIIDTLGCNPGKKAGVDDLLEAMKIQLDKLEKQS